MVWLVIQHLHLMSHIQCLEVTKALGQTEHLIMLADYATAAASCCQQTAVNLLLLPAAAGLLLLYLVRLEHNFTGWCDSYTVAR